MPPTLRRWFPQLGITKWPGISLFVEPAVLRTLREVEARQDLEKAKWRS
jgi:hypothetical protein